MSLGFLYYRKDLLEKHNIQVPTTWQGVESAINELLPKEQNPMLSGFVTQFGGKYKACGFVLESTNNDSTYSGGASHGKLD
jgi:ABC-type glycerol-3-phosphate transport system substrate-binding protein